ncbi:hypothetical protein AM501_10125 [Aneurinibacillus migulanus]|uniref:hypothetical protein n=1 Tax=Aneurinibacillus migulanus TaxID=47500 RepID=UPI0005BBDE56|nr:hypothetical protein [Aneurinibacillus migulanus]KIV55827.1 hypothetical protein TS64_11635 [Aneurinibacillus migulanus]KPD08413.1 hypothetical protein AM501_10125 [Aneurinibacillus migulanus]
MKKLGKLLLVTPLAFSLILPTTGVFAGESNDAHVKVAEVEAPKLELTQEKKEDLYNQYVKIVADVAAQYPESGIFIEPLDTFKDEYFMSPEDYRAFAVNLATSSIVVAPETPSDVITPLSTGIKTKYATITFGGNSRSIAVTGTFTIDHFLGRMGFTAIKSLTSKSADSRGTWRQSGYNEKIYDAGETMNVSVGGTYTENGVSKPDNFELNFYCSGNGEIS